jgi:hypothetical protein
MPLYEYECPLHGVMTLQHSMSQAGGHFFCGGCGEPLKRIFTPPHFVEDRVRLFSNTIDGTKFDYVLGNERPDNRRDYYRELDRIGAEPVSRATEPAVWKENREYAQHVKTGGERVKSFEKAAHPATKRGELTVLQQLKQSGVKIP